MQQIARLMPAKILPLRREVQCEECKDLGWVNGIPCTCKSGEREREKERQATLNAQTAAEQAAQAAAERRIQKVREKLERAGGFQVPPKYEEYSPKSLGDTYGETVYRKKEMAIKHMLAWSDGRSPKPGVLLTGDPGTGKTALALWAMRRREARTGEAPLLIRYADFIGSVQETYSNNGDATKRELIHATQTAPLLMLDDFGEVALRGAAASVDKQGILLEVLDYRTQRDMPTIIISNLNQAELTIQFNGAILSRLVELCALVTMNGIDLRRKEAIGWQL